MKENNASNSGIGKDKVLPVVEEEKKNNDKNGVQPSKHAMTTSEETDVHDSRDEDEEIKKLKDEIKELLSDLSEYGNLQSSI